jgi:hypothetical protein
VTKQSKREYIKEIRSRYRASSKPEQSNMLDEMVKVTKFNRKYLIRILQKTPVPIYPRSIVDAMVKKKAGAPPIYHAPALVTFLERLWHATDQACSKRLRSLLPLWLPWYRDDNGAVLSMEHQVLLTRIAHSTIDRLLAPERRQYRVGKGRCTTKPGTLALRESIPFATEQWKERRPGFVEVDTVAHCGLNSQGGQYVFSLDAVEMAFEWVEARAVWGKGETGVLEAFRDIEEALPVPLRGFDSDNGGEFINHHLQTYLRGRHRSVEPTRSRPYKKNDNAHIEQKNWTHIRQVFGYGRFDNLAVVPLMNDLYANEFSLMRNYFLPSVKLMEKNRVGSKIVKIHDRPQTPCDRILCSPLIPEDTKRRLRAIRKTLNPFLLHEIIQRKIKAILDIATIAPHQPINIPQGARRRAPDKKQGKSAVIAPHQEHLSPPHRSLPRVRNTSKTIVRKTHGN